MLIPNFQPRINTNKQEEKQIFSFVFVSFLDDRITDNEAGQYKILRNSSKTIDLVKRSGVIVSTILSAYFKLCVINDNHKILSLFQVWFEYDMPDWLTWFLPFLMNKSEECGQMAESSSPDQQQQPQLQEQQQQQQQQRLEQIPSLGEDPSNPEDENEKENVENENQENVKNDKEETATQNEKSDNNSSPSQQDKIKNDDFKPGIFQIRGERMKSRIFKHFAKVDHLAKAIE